MPASASVNTVADRAVITGTGLVCSLGLHRSEAWDALVAGGDGVSPIRRFDAAGFACSAAAVVEGLDPASLGIPHREARIMDLQAYMLLKAGRDAHDMAGLSAAPYGREQIGFFAGMGMNDYDVDDLRPAVLGAMAPGGVVDYDAFYSKTYREIYPLWPLSMLNNVGFCQVSIRLDLQGENTVFSPHGDSGLLALADAAKTVCEGSARAVLAGGVSEKVSPLSLGRAQLHGMLSTAGGEARCRPFCTERRGSVPGEGCGIVVFEGEESARSRGAVYSSYFAGSGVACGPEPAFGGPTRQAFSLAMRQALGDAEMTAGEIDLLIAHGDGSVTGDDNEMAAVSEVFAACRDTLKVYSSKGALGNLLAGGPAVDLVLATEMISRGTIPATARAMPIDERMRGLVVTETVQHARLRAILINAASVEGQAASIIIRKAG